MRHALVLIVVAMWLPGCAGEWWFGTRGPSGHTLTQQDRARLIYPAESELGEDLDIVVEPLDSNELRITNRTPVVFEDVHLWLNQRFMQPMDRVVIGENPNLRLRDAIDRHGDVYPTAGFLTPDQGLRVVLAEIYDPKTGKRHRLRVMLQER